MQLENDPSEMAENRTPREFTHLCGKKTCDQVSQSQSGIQLIFPAIGRTSNQNASRQIEFKFLSEASLKPPAFSNENHDPKTAGLQFLGNDLYDQEVELTYFIR